MTLSEFELAIHWPFIRDRLVLDRTPAWIRVLDTLTEEQAWSDGTPVPMRKRLAAHCTQGELGNAWRALVELEARGVVYRYPSGGQRGGRRPDLWSVRPHRFGSRWRVPWRRSGHHVETAVSRCVCVARGLPFAARFPGQSFDVSRDGAFFRLPPGSHQGPGRDTNNEARATDGPATWGNGLSRAASGPPLTFPLENVRPPSSSVTEDDGALRTLQEAIEAATGAKLFGSPLDELAAVAARCNGHVEALAGELRAATGTRSPVVLARRAGELLCLVQERDLGRQWATLEHQRRRLAFLSAVDRDELSPDQAQELDHLLGTMDPGA